MFLFRQIVIIPMQEGYDVNERIRSLESKYDSLRARMIIVNENLVDEYKKLSDDIKVLDSELKDLKKDIFEMKDALRHVLTELQHFARKEHFQVLEKYINMWNPFNFVTEGEVLKIINEKRGVKNRKSKKPEEK